MTALDVTTGKPVWVHRFVKNDVWDYDTPAQPSLIDFPKANGKVPALVQTTKFGDIFVLDRRNGNLLTPVKDEPVPQGGVELKNPQCVLIRPTIDVSQEIGMLL